MNFRAKVAASMMLPIAVIAIQIAIFSWKIPAPELTPAERELLNFSPRQVQLNLPKPVPLFTGARNPVTPPEPKRTEASAKASSFPPGPIPGAKGGEERKSVATSQLLPELSMIYSDGGVKIAIIDGHVMREGSETSGLKIIRITKNRVLARTGGKEIWLTIE